MGRFQQWIVRCAVTFCVVAMCGLLVQSARAASINYGNFGPIPPSGVSFLNVTESSGTDPVPLYGPPTPFNLGLDFNPQSFVSTASGGASDITDGQLNFTAAGDITPPTGSAISMISLFESGDYSLVGTGTTATQALAGVIIRATVTQIDGVNVAPINLAPSNASVGFNLVANPGIVQPWSLGTTININGQLAGMGKEFTLGATRVDVAINNTLITTSQPASLSFISKKEFQLNLTPVVGTIAPEPATGAIVLIGL